MSLSLTQDEIVRLCDVDEEECPIYTLDFSLIPSPLYHPLFLGLHRFFVNSPQVLIFQCSIVEPVSELSAALNSVQALPPITTECPKFVRWLMRILRHCLWKSQNLISLGLCDLPPFNVDRFIGEGLAKSTSLQRLILQGVLLNELSLKILLSVVSPFHYEELRLLNCGLDGSNRRTVYRYLKRGRASRQRWTLAVFDLSRNGFDPRDLEKFERLLRERMPPSPIVSDILPDYSVEEEEVRAENAELVKLGVTDQFEEEEEETPAIRAPLADPLGEIVEGYVTMDDDDDK
jgi:hypothetical protein